MKTFAVSEFKAKCIAELKTVQQTGEELEITLRGRPLARVVPVREKGRQLGAQAGSMDIIGEIIASNLDDDFAPFVPPPSRRRSRA